MFGVDPHKALAVAVLDNEDTPSESFFVRLPTGPIDVLTGLRDLAWSARSWPGQVGTFPGAGKLDSQAFLSFNRSQRSHSSSCARYGLMDASRRDQKQLAAGDGFPEVGPGLRADVDEAAPGVRPQDG